MALMNVFYHRSPDNVYQKDVSQITKLNTNLLLVARAGNCGEAFSKLAICGNCMTFKFCQHCLMHSNYQYICHYVKFTNMIMNEFDPMTGSPTV